MSTEAIVVTLIGFAILAIIIVLIAVEDKR